MNEELPATGYAVIRCQDCAVVAKFDSFPDVERALMYRRRDTVSFMPLNDDDIIGTPSLFTKMLEKAGYRVSYCARNQ
ncbi:hypothetical protein LVQ79_10310 [Buttiauxella sp. A2-C1_F]|uniref:hypothetical protein n=1 Tax=Buttiauxella sp. A2-C1_F TaxID=2904526 RepID=UPI001E526EB6|nr:hypothetical protein [Buttiauxella sp. A2-C1_F]